MRAEEVRVDYAPLPAVGRRQSGGGGTQGRLGSLGALSP